MLTPSRFERAREENVFWPLDRRPRNGERSLRILLCSYTFAPAIGGIETSSRIQARGFVQAGHSVEVATLTPGESSHESYNVSRKPSFRKLWSLTRQADVVLHNNISLRLILPALLQRKQIVITHHTYICGLGEPKRWQERLKLLALKRSVNVAVSRALAQTLPVEAHLIPNAYEKDDFCRFRNEPKTRDIVFVGRLVSDKGVDLLVRALSALKSSGLKPSLTIVGEGPERSALQDLSVQLGVDDRVYFAGRVEGEARGELVGSHRIMAIPSRWAEPFGIVALEGIAAGCALVGSRNGGLPEAIGPCGLLFENGDAEALAIQLRRLLNDSLLLRELTDQGPQFLSNFSPEAIIARYLEVFRPACDAGYDPATRLLRNPSPTTESRRIG